MHAIDTHEIDIVDETSNQLTSTGKLIVGTALFVVLILTVFIVDFFSMSSHADLPSDAMGTCQVEYSDTALLPVSENGSGQDTQNAEPVIKHTYAITMPDGQVVEGYGVNGTYVPLDGEYAFSGVLREDGSYNITVDSSYIPTSIEDVHEASRDIYNSEKASVTQVISDFVWMPSDESFVSGESNDEEVPTGTQNQPNDTSQDVVPDNNEDLTDSNATDTNIDTSNSINMTVEEKLAVELPASANPMEISGRVVDGANESHEGVAGPDTSINVVVDYRNLFALSDFTLVATVTNVRDGSTIKNADGTDMIVVRDFTTNESITEPTTPDGAKLDDYRSAFNAVLALAYESSSDAVLPSTEEVDAILSEAAKLGGKVIVDNKILFEPIYMYAATAESATAKELPSLQQVANICEQIYSSDMKTRLSDGTFEMNIPLPADSVRGKTVNAKIEVVYNGDVVAVLPGNVKDSNYYVSYPGIDTEATIRGSHEAKAEAGTVIIDTVEYENLVPGVQYHLESTVLDEDTQSIVIDSSTGEKVKFITEFVPEKSSGVINVIFPDFDSSSMMGRRAVVTEKIFRCETNVTDVNAKQGEEAESSDSNSNTSGILHSSQKGMLVAQHEEVDNPLATIDFNQEISLAETGGEIGTISAMGETPRPYILGGVIIASLIAIAVLRMRQRM